MSKKEKGSVRKGHYPSQWIPKYLRYIPYYTTKSPFVNTFLKNSLKVEFRARRKNMSNQKKKPITRREQTAKETQKIVGGVYRGRTKYIDPEPKLERNYVAVKANSNKVSVVKMKSYKKDYDPHLVEMDQKKYSLEKRTGVDHEMFSKNRMSGKDLKITDRDAFPKGAPEFRLSSHDTHRVLYHVEVWKKKKPKSK